MTRTRALLALALPTILAGTLEELSAGPKLRSEVRSVEIFRYLVDARPDPAGIDPSANDPLLPVLELSTLALVVPLEPDEQIISVRGELRNGIYRIYADCKATPE